MVTSSGPPVLLVPGIGGTMLRSVNKKTQKKERVWVTTLNPDGEFKDHLWSIYNEETGLTESLDQEATIEVPEDRFGLYAIEDLCPSAVDLTVGNYYKDMMNYMKDNWKYEEGKNLFGFGYDFRQSTRSTVTMDRLRKKVKDIHEKTGQKVVIITHSMGGLVTKSFLALYKDEFAAHVDTWIAIAAPFRGASGYITDTLLVGPNFVSEWMEDLFVKRWTGHQLLQQCPSVFEMMAQYDNFKWNETPQVRIFFKDAKAGDNVPAAIKSVSTTAEWVDLIKGCLKDNTITHKGKTIPVPLNDKLVEWALKTKRIWETAEIPAESKFYNVYGLGNDTPFHVSYGSISDPVDSKNLEDLFDEKGQFWNVDGDGTVPFESSSKDGLNAVERVAFKNTHSGIIKDKKVYQYLEKVLKIPPRASLKISYGSVPLRPTMARGKSFNVFSMRSLITSFVSF